MKSKWIFVLAMFFAAVSPAFSQTTTITTTNGGEYDRTYRWDAGLNLSGAVAGDEGIDDGVFIGGNVSYGFQPWFALGLEAGYQDTSTENDDLSAVPIFVDGIFRFPNHQMNAPIVPYGVVGVGAIIWDYEGTDEISQLDDNIDSSFAVKGGAGVDWFLNPNWALNLEIAYVYADDDIELTRTTRSDLDYWTVGGGIKYIF
jgi:opacity protein-like surface antigen